MAQNYFVSSNFGVRYFLLAFTNTSTIPASASTSDEITGVLSADIGTFNKENTKYRTLNGNGWESIAPLGNAAEDITFECIREGTGNPYIGVAGNDSYTKLKNWFMTATSNAGQQSPMCIIEVLPRGGSDYEGTLYYVIPNQWAPGTRDTETGQEYSFSVSPFGPQVPIKVIYTPSPEGWKFTAVDAGGDSGE